MIVLGIETSCDDTSVALVRDGREILAQSFASQLDVHEAFGGVVPELASRAHLALLPPTLESALDAAGLELRDVDAVAATYGPGLVGALLVGLMAGKSLAAGLDRPFVGVNHLQAHLVAPLLCDPEFDLPFLGLLVSGGHTLLVRFDHPTRVEILGRTRDDAAGEAFDKLARAMGLGYPGGRPVEERARSGDRDRVPLPRPALPGELDTSFSGLKSAVLRLLESGEHRVEDLCAALQAVIVEALDAKLRLALERVGLERVVLAGGVAANGPLRERIGATCREMGRRLFCPPPVLCTDNGAMVAAMGSLKLRHGLVDPVELGPVPNLKAHVP